MAATTLASPVPPASPEPQPFVDMTKVPEWLLTHPELRKREITLHRPLQPFTVYVTKLYLNKPAHVVKAIDPSRQEIPMYDLFDQLPGSPISKHTIPHEIVRCERPLLIMPFASPALAISSPTTSSILAVFDQILEAVEHLHRLHISHGDIFLPNVVAATEKDVSRDPRLIAGRAYLIDFESCQQFEHGPRVQTAVPLPNTHVKPPLDMKSFDPFSWDVYCLGRTLEYMVQYKFFKSTDRELPLILGLCVRWLKGNERGCTSVCRCRPTVTRARQVLALVRRFVRVGELFVAIVTYPIALFMPPQAHRARNSSQL